MDTLKVSMQVSAHRSNSSPHVFKAKPREISLSNRQSDDYDDHSLSNQGSAQSADGPVSTLQNTLQSTLQNTLQSTGITRNELDILVDKATAGCVPTDDPSTNIIIEMGTNEPPLVFPHDDYHDPLFLNGNLVYDWGTGR